jgi:thiosulfate/3-mercaptopyruvate sulfurtransferase
MSRPAVAYDDWASLPASRVWWMLRHLGFLDVRVLDGGIAVWTTAASPLNSVRPRRKPATSHHPASEWTTSWTPQTPPRMPPGTSCSLLAPPIACAGKTRRIDAAAGHITGAVSVPALANIDKHARFLPAEELA